MGEKRTRDMEEKVRGWRMTRKDGRGCRREGWTGQGVTGRDTGSNEGRRRRREGEQEEQEGMGERTEFAGEGGSPSVSVTVGSNYTKWSRGGGGLGW